MEKKICTKCQIYKEKTDFHVHKKNKDGLYVQCKECRKSKSKSDYYNNINKEKKIVQEKICCACNLKKNIEYFHKHKGSKDGYRSSCKECRSKKFRLEYDKIKESHNLRAKNYRIYNREKYNKSRNKLYRKKPHVFAWRGMLNSVIKRLGKNKENKTIEILGYSPIQLKIHIEKLFTEGMSWENWGEWHIDHIKPVSFFDKNTDPKIINDLSNLQPLWGSENIRKSNKILI